MGTVQNIDMNKIILRAKINNSKQPADHVYLSNLAEWRDHMENCSSKNDTARLEVIAAFANLRDLFKLETQTILSVSNPSIKSSIS